MRGRLRPQSVRSSAKRVHPFRDHHTDRRTGGLVGVGPQMAVDVERRSCGGVPHPRLHGLDVRAGGDQQRSQVVAQIVKAELLRQPSTFRLTSRIARSMLQGGAQSTPNPLAASAPTLLVADPRVTIMSPGYFCTDADSSSARSCGIGIAASLPGVFSGSVGYCCTGCTTPLVKSPGTLRRRLPDAARFAGQVRARGRTPSASCHRRSEPSGPSMPARRICSGWR
jgi:hypothetical protein